VNPGSGFGPARGFQRTATSVEVRGAAPASAARPHPSRLRPLRRPRCETVPEKGSFRGASRGTIAGSFGIRSLTLRRHGEHPGFGLERRAHAPGSPSSTSDYRVWSDGGPLLREDDPAMPQPSGCAPHAASSDAARGLGPSGPCGFHGRRRSRSLAVMSGNRQCDEWTV
jgi:hypothetical protein